MTRSLIGLAFLMCTLWFPGVAIATDRARDAAGSAPAASAESSPNIRPLRPWIGALLDSGGAPSATLAALVERVRTARLIVHIEEATATRGPWDGRLQFVAVAGGWTYVRVELHPMPTPTAKAILAHELQHALEVADAGVRSKAEFEALFSRIGFTVAHEGRAFYDTDAAVAAGVATFYELTGTRPRASARTAAARLAGQHERR